VQYLLDLELESSDHWRGTQAIVRHARHRRRRPGAAPGRDRQPDLDHRLPEPVPRQQRLVMYSESLWISTHSGAISMGNESPSRTNLAIVSASRAGGLHAY
jgi:hypothetical protein